MARSQEAQCLRGHDGWVTRAATATVDQAKLQPVVVLAESVR
jgi:hypothetical protein